METKKVAKDDSSNYGLEDNGIKLLFGEINNDSAHDIVEWIISENFKRKHSFLTIVINSPGGYVSDAFAIIDAICGSNIPVRMIGLGTICSCGLLIFMTGAKGYRMLTPNTEVMSHQFATGTYGKHHELIAQNRNWSLVDEKINAVYLKGTKLPIAKIKKLLLSPQDVYISADEALKYGICDVVKPMGVDYKPVPERKPR
jgi:ATP-dependent Clp protease protease subunit